MNNRKKQQLKPEAICFLKQDNELCLMVANELSVSIFSLPPIIHRNSRRLTEYQVVSKIAEKMGKNARDIIETAA